MIIENTLTMTDIQNTNEHTLNIRGMEIFVHEHGGGLPLLLLHGSPDSGDMWFPLIDHLGDNFRYIAPDLPGFGQSTLSEDFGLALDDMADFIHDLIKALNIEEPVALVTTDFGGHYGLAFTVKYPELVRGVAISNTNFFHDYEWHFFAKMYRVPLLGELLVNSASRSMMHKTLKSVSPAMPESYIEHSYDKGFGSKSVRKTILRMYRSRSSSDFVGWEDKLISLLQEKPAIVLWGDQDPFISPEYAERFGKAQVHHFKDYSHWLPLEAPAGYAQVLLPWLKTL